MNCLYLEIPAKALLFGEYGVLYGGKAIAVTFFSNSFKILIKIKKCNISKFIEIKSDFFEEGQIRFPKEYLASFDLKEKNTNIMFFVNLLKPWGILLTPYKLEIIIEQSFSPSLGFGSSSALIAGISRGLWEFLYKDNTFLDNPEFWNRVRESILNIQGNGSGYDVAVQLMASQIHQNEKKVGMWIFQNNQNSNVPTIKSFITKENIVKYGCFLSTNIYSDTKKSISSFQNDDNKLNFAKQHAILAENFILNNSIENLKNEMEKSLFIANQQGIVPVENIKFLNLIFRLKTKNISYKTMGAGNGDCLWVLANKSVLTRECSISENDIPFSFEN